jgi:hypothetical protein
MLNHIFCYSFTRELNAKEKENSQRSILTATSRQQLPFVKNTNRVTTIQEKSVYALILFYFFDASIHNG